MRILVTGATGGLGRNATEYLLQRGITVRATGRNPLIGKMISRLGAEFIAADLAYASSMELTALVNQTDAVWHCAALSSPWGAVNLFELSNVRATENLLAAAGKAGVERFVHISSPAIYFDFKNRYDIKESFQVKVPVNEYARTKIIAEQKVHEATVNYPTMRTTILRPRAIFGPHDQVLIPRFMHILRKKNGHLPLPRGGRTILDMTYVENVVYAMWLATNQEALPSGLTCNITNAEPNKIAKVLEQLFVKELQQKMRIVDVPYFLVAIVSGAMEFFSIFTKKEPRLTRYSAGVLAYDMTLNISQAQTMLGYVPPVSMDQGIARTAAWLRKNG